MGSQKKGNFSHFCFCLGLRTGVIISSALWMLEGIVLLILLVSNKGNEDTGTLVYKPLLIVQSVYLIILTIISAIGLTSLIIFKSMLFLRMYSYVSCFFAVFLNSALAIATFVTRNEYNYNSFWLAVFLLFQFFLHLYFSFILRAYLKGNKPKINSSKHSSNNHVMNIKVDKTFDVRNQIV